MNMIEKIAARDAEFDGRELIAMPMADRKRYFQRARIAIETMRNLTPEMVVCCGADDEQYQGMIDAALAE